MSVEDGFDWLLDGEWDFSPVAVAVSGGGDSLALLHMAAATAFRTGRPLRAVTVDHRLRPASASEASFVGTVCKDLNIPHEILVWDHGPIKGNLMAAARDARYRLLTDWARSRGVRYILLGHTADDQAETFLMGLSRAAGLDGLSGMRPGWRQDGVIFMRPVLGMTRASLRNYLLRKGLSWIDDPTNDDGRFARIKARHALQSLEPLGITVDRLATTIRNLSYAQDAVRWAVRRAADELVSETVGSLSFKRDELLVLGNEIPRRLLIAMIRWIGGAPHPPRAAQIAELDVAIYLKRDATLGGVRFRWSGDTCTVSRELRAVGGAVQSGQVWDGRWQLRCGEGEIRALGTEGLRQCPDWRATGLPRHVLEVTPGLWLGQTLLAAPCAGFGTGTATCTPSFADHLLSH